MKLKILHIYENDYGCEETADDEEIKYITVTENENGEQSEFLLTDSFLSGNDLNEGSSFDTSLLP